MSSEDGDPIAGEKTIQKEEYINVVGRDTEKRNLR
jgi:hypothetical protein